MFHFLGNLINGSLSDTKVIGTIKNYIKRRSDFVKTFFGKGNDASAVVWYHFDQSILRKHHQSFSNGRIADLQFICHGINIDFFAQCIFLLQYFLSDDFVNLCFQAESL